MPFKGTVMHRGRKFLLQFVSELETSNIFPKEFSIHSSIQTDSSI